MSSERVVLVSTTCPFCGGSVPIRNERTVESTADVAARWAGQQLVCWNPRCEKSFWVRRVDLRIRRRLVAT
jgi:hypothetical protein